MAIVEQHRMRQRPAAGRLINVTIALSVVRPLWGYVRRRLAVLFIATGSRWQILLAWSLLPLAGWLASESGVINGRHLLAAILAASAVLILRRHQDVSD